MYDFKPSEYYLNYCKENGTELADLDLAAAIINEDLDPLDGEKPTLEERLAALRNIAAKTEDSELKALIFKVEETSKAAFDRLKKGGENSIYEVHAVLGVTDKEYLEKDLSSWEQFFFYDYKTAYNYMLTKVAAQGDLRSFDIERIKVFTGEEEPKTDSWEECADFNSRGSLLRIYGEEVVWDKFHKRSAVKDPFNKWDVVRHCAGGEFGIVLDHNGDWTRSVSVCFKFGDFLKSRVWGVNPMCLEKIDASSPPELRESAVGFIREQSEHTSNDKVRAALEKTIKELSKA